MKRKNHECPECGSLNTKVIDTDRRASGPTVRTYECEECEHKFKTGQLPEFLLETPMSRHVAETAD